MLSGDGARYRSERLLECCFFIVIVRRTLFCLNRAFCYDLFFVLVRAMREKSKAATPFLVLI
jgi:hypothetical protein